MDQPNLLLSRIQVAGAASLDSTSTYATRYSTDGASSGPRDEVPECIGCIFGAFLKVGDGACARVGAPERSGHLRSRTAMQR